mgnify:CR=1 FL=1
MPMAGRRNPLLVDRTDRHVGPSDDSHKGVVCWYLVPPAACGVSWISTGRHHTLLEEVRVHLWMEHKTSQHLCSRSVCLLFDKAYLLLDNSNAGNGFAHTTWEVILLLGHGWLPIACLAKLGKHLLQLRSWGQSCGLELKHLFHMGKHFVLQSLSLLLCFLLFDVSLCLCFLSFGMVVFFSFLSFHVMAQESLFLQRHPNAHVKAAWKQQLTLVHSWRQAPEQWTKGQVPEQQLV